MAAVCCRPWTLSKGLRAKALEVQLHDARNNNRRPDAEAALARLRSLDPAGGSGSAAVLFADGRLYFRYQSGILVLIEPNPKELKVVSSFKLPEADQRSHPQSWPHPVIANGKLYVRDQTVMYCYDVTAGGAGR